MKEEIVTLTVDGLRLAGFQQVNVAWSMKNAAISFGVRATNPAWSKEAFALRFAREVELRAGGDLLCRGPVEDYESDEEGGSDRREVRVSGKSKGVLAVRHPPIRHKTGRIENKTLLEAAKELDEAGVGFTTDMGKLSPITMIQRHPADSVFDTVERHARAQGAMLMGMPDGSIKLTRGSDKRHAGELRQGQAPMKRFKLKVSQKNRASQTVVRGQRRIGIGAAELRQEETVFDPNAGGFRPAIVFSETDQDRRQARDRGEWQRLRQASWGGLSVSVTVAGWRDADGELWEPGRLVFLAIPTERVEQDMRLESVTFTQDAEKGTVAELTLVDPSATGKANRGGKAAAGRNKSDPGYGVNPPQGSFAPEGQ